MTAFAADMGAPVYKAPPPPPPAPVYNWTGCYVDGGAGYGLWSQDHSMTGPYGPGGAVETTVTTHDGGRGWLGRFGGGCDYQFSAGGWGNWVVGVFGDYDFMNLTGSKEKVLHSFGYGSDGATPQAGLIDVNGTLYGTTSAGGANGNGTVFALSIKQ